MSRTPRERHLAPTPWSRAVLCCGVSLVTAAGCTLTTPTPPPTPPAPVSSTFPEMTGAELDRSLRSGAQGGESSLPPFGQLLASTENGGPTTISFDTAGLDSEIVGVFVCGGEGPGPEVSVTRGDTSLLWFRAEGCDPGNLYSGRSQPVSGSGAATLRVTTPPGMRYSLVLEQVTKG